MLTTLAAVTFADGIGMDDLTWLAGLLTVVATIVGAVWPMTKGDLMTQTTTVREATSWLF